ncbi:hypothetical protein F4678DRAFT_23662 [Xylaria arbuscula]|nr:hypothetical protein F4678DRAFT_23662 [Xylaria arbuscula]
MEPRGRQRSRRLGSIPPPTDPYQRELGLSADDSSDGDDDDIPACKLPSVSPSKSLSLSASRPSHVQTNRTKRSLSDAAHGGIVLYPGSKKPRNGYNMVPVSRKSLAHSTPDSLRPPIPAHSRTNSLSSGEEVREGLVRCVNDAFRHLHTRQALDSEEQLEPQGALFYHLLDGTEIKAEELENVGNRADDQVSYLSLNTSNSISSAPPILNDVLEVTHSAPVPAYVTPHGDIPAETGAQTRVEIVSPPPSGAWDIPGSPGQTDTLETIPEAPPQKLQPTKRRGRPPKSSANILVDKIPSTGKKKVGRPRKHYPQLHDEADKDYITRIARLRKERIPSSSDSDTHLLPQSLPALNGTAPGVTTALGLHPKDEPNEDAVWGVNDTESGVREDSVDDRRRIPRRDDQLAPDELIGHNDKDSVDSNAEETDGTLSESIDGFESDSGSRDDGGWSENSFECDVNAFKARQTCLPEDDEVFEDPSDDDVLAVHLDYQPLKQLVQLLGGKPWAAEKGGWHSRDFHHEHAKSKPARALLTLLTKLERLYQAAPKAPNLKEQNKFLGEHANMLRYYFYKIKMVVEHIRTKRLVILEASQTNQGVDLRKRKRMTRDLVLYVIPMLAHVLVSAWKLGGKLWTKTSFTSTTVELLKRVLGWIMLLHHRLLSELAMCPFEEEPANQREKQAWHERNNMRKEVTPILDDLYQVICAAPDGLAEAEARVKEELKQRQEELRREKQLRIERQALAAERKKQSLLSIRAIHSRLESPALSSRPASSSTPGSSDWSVEERRLLFLRIQASFPVCPNLNALRWELNKTLAQTVTMTEQILEKMLERVCVGYSAEERAAKLGQIMQSSGVAGGHS